MPLPPCKEARREGTALGTTIGTNDNGAVRQFMV